MKDCDCEKNKVDDNWIPEDDYGDYLLTTQNLTIIKKIKEDLQNYEVNDSAIFNIEFQNNSLDDIVIDS